MWNLENNTAIQGYRTESAEPENQKFKAVVLGIETVVPQSVVSESPKTIKVLKITNDTICLKNDRIPQNFSLTHSIKYEKGVALQSPCEYQLITFLLKALHWGKNNI